MSDEIKKLIAESLARNQQHAAHVEGAEMWEWLATFLLRDLGAAGWRIEPDWSADLDAVPRDTEVLVCNENGFFRVAEWDSDTGVWRETAELSELKKVTHWKPITPPESE